VPLGVTFSFLISAPMVNEVALVLLFGLVGWQVAVIYLVSGLTLAIVAGWVIGRLGMESEVEDWVYQIEMGAQHRSSQRRRWPAHDTDQLQAMLIEQVRHTPPTRPPTR